MSHSDSPKQSSLFLWFIVPAAAILTLMFVNINNNAAAPKAELPGAIPAKEVEEVKHEEHVAADTTAHVTDGENMEVAKPEEAKVEETKIVVEGASKDPKH
jgi:hypothetical protein